MNATLKVINKMVEDGIIRRYAIAGAVGALYYLEPIATSDLDVLISFDEMRQPQKGLVTLAPIAEYLRKAGYPDFKDEGLLVEGWPVQFLPVASDLDAEGLDRAIEFEMPDDPPIKVRVLRAEHLVATALRVGRDKDFIRVSTFLEQKRVDLQLLRDVLTRHQLWRDWSDFCRRTGLGDRDILDLRP